MNTLLELLELQRTIGDSNLDSVRSKIIEIAGRDPRFQSWAGLRSVEEPGLATKSLLMDTLGIMVTECRRHRRVRWQRAR